ncbi:MAG: hypothetical protein WC455_16090 [Dehalococcoidia bacterium]|jgi:hypothetical protein
MLSYARQFFVGEAALKWWKDFFESADDQDSWQAKKIADVLFKDGIVEKMDATLQRAEMADKDFLHYRIHRTGFDIQQRIVMSKCRHKFLMAGRRAGKTEACARMIADVLCDGGRAHYIHKTLTTGIEQIYKPVMDLCEDLGIKVAEKHRNEGTVAFENGGFFKISGNVTVEEREKKRGEKWNLVIVDEAQSQAALLYMIDNILEPELIDYAGTLVVGGTGPRVRGTFWEAVYLGQWPDGRPLYPDSLRINWNLSDNPFIPNHQTALAQIRADKGLTEESALYQREYLGRIVYDDDALVLRLGDANYYDDQMLAGWIGSQPVTDIRFTGGLDFGFIDSDAVSIICYSVSKPERWLVYEYKGNRTGIAELAAKIMEGVAYVNGNPMFARVENRRFFIYADTGGAGKKISFDLATQYNLPIQDAYKADKDMAIELLQDEVRKGLLRVRRDGPFADECMKTVFKRNDRDEITREIDDETYHPDMMDGVTYAMRPVWLFNRSKA